MRKFNIGDKVVTINADFYGNEFHYWKMISTYKVSDATDDYFSINGSDVDVTGHPSRCFFQSNGCCCKPGAFERLYHAEKDADEIQSVLDGYRNKFKETVKNDVESEIEKLETQIMSIQNKIDKLKSGEYALRYGSLYNLKDYIEKVEQNIEKSLK